MKYTNIDGHAMNGADPRTGANPAGGAVRLFAIPSVASVAGCEAVGDYSAASAFKYEGHRN